MFARIVPCETSAPDCADQSLSTFGERAFRQPRGGCWRLELSDWEVASRLSYVMGVQSDGFGLPEGMGGATMLGGVYSRLLV